MSQFTATQEFQTVAARPGERSGGRPGAAADTTDAPRGLPEGGGSFWWFTAVPGWITSSVVHAIIILVLALVTIPLPEKPHPENVLVLRDTQEVSIDLTEFRTDNLTAPDPDLQEDNALVATHAEVSTPDFFPPSTNDLTTAPIKPDPLSLESMISGDLSHAIGQPLGQALSGRSSPAARQRLLREAGGTEGSEAAVASGLRWLAEHQNPDGSWSLDHRTNPRCRGACGNPGTRAHAEFGATGLALLPFLGAGHTHLQGDYRLVVERGIDFLLRNITQDGERGLLVDKGGNYYSHGLCAIVLCESFAMTQDERLRLPAQLLINETVYAQNPVDGGWRYTRHESGDTSVLGWHLMAMKSAHLGGLQVPAATIQRASHFLDRVMAVDKFRYRYRINPATSKPVDPTKPRRFQYRRSISSVGLLCRMYLGWQHDDERLQAGVQWLSKQGPSLANRKPEIYYDYYATQVMRHFGGDAWVQWNEQMRDRLIAVQSVSEHEAGSWFFDNKNQSHHESGGRLYCTSLATMILEVYYRYLPIYQSGAVDEEFPL